jgi:hypothetical protein
MLKTVGLLSSRTGDQTIINGNLVIATSGQGIDFSATSGTGTSELLSDYEEGTFTPTAIGGTTTGTTTYTTQNGNYTKVGNVVTVWGEITVTGATGTGNLRFGGFPFTSGSSGAPSIGSVQTSGLAWSQAPSSSSLYVNPNATYAVIYNSVDNGGWGVTSVENGAWSVYYTISYRV